MIKTDQMIYIINPHNRVEAEHIDKDKVETRQMAVAQHAKHFGARIVVANVWVETLYAVVNNKMPVFRHLIFLETEWQKVARSK